MENEFKKYSEEILIAMAKGSDNEEFPFALSELENRKHPKTAELCLLQISRSMKSEKEMEKEFYSLGETRSTLSTLYFFDKQQAITFFKEHYKETPLDAFAGFIGLYVDTYYREEEIDKDLINLIKAHLKTLKKNEIAEIKDDYDAFMKAYKNV